MRKTTAVLTLAAALGLGLAAPAAAEPPHGSCKEFGNSFLPFSQIDKGFVGFYFSQILEPGTADDQLHHEMIELGFCAAP